jgi:asparagine synthase (glutamine-hydrolysing)
MGACPMCGIVGFIDNQISEAASRAQLHQMNETIIHRGPDDEGYFTAANVGLAMRRLSIIDLAGGHQPVYNENGNSVLVFNGEIYNYKELTQELVVRGHKFRTVCDTETIIHLYEDEGLDCVQYLRGMYAFAIWDKERQRLLVARDRLGIKPMYFLRANGRLVFASEIKAILKHPSVRAEVNLEALNDFLSLRYVPAPKTMFARIESLPPGYVLIYEDGKIDIRAYWRLSFAAIDYRRSEASYLEELGALVREAVRLHLRTDVPFGAFLSGGVDSSTIVALMSEFLDEPVKTFSVGYEGNSELPYARVVANTFQTDHREIMIKGQDFPRLAEKVIWHLEQPLADQATLAAYMVSRLAAGHVKMVLTGEGGDELFAGYARYSWERLAPWFNHFPTAASSGALALTERLPGLRRPKIALWALCQPDEVTRITNWFPLFNEDRRAALLTGSFRNALGRYSTTEVVAHHLTQTDAREPINRMLYIDTKLWLPDYLLLRGDKLSMAASIEHRLPLLDHKLVEFAATVPPHFKINGLTSKYLLKRFASTLIPARVVSRKKKGFPIPIGHWFRYEAREFIRDVLCAESIRRRGLFNPAAVAKLLQEHQDGFANHSVLLWGLANVELWHRQFIDAHDYQRAAA